MKHKLMLVLVSVAALIVTASVAAQENISAAEKLDNLRLQLIEVQAREESLKSRAEELEQDLKPENIERSLAGIGSTRPEELRENRRRQLTIERDGVLSQLRIVESNRVRLEAAIASMESRAYHESASPPPPPTQKVAAAPQTLPYLMIIVACAAVLTIVAGVVIISMFRKKTL